MAVQPARDVERPLALPELRARPEEADDGEELPEEIDALLHLPDDVRNAVGLCKELLARRDAVGITVIFAVGPLLAVAPEIGDLLFDALFEGSEIVFGAGKDGVRVRGEVLRTAVKFCKLAEEVIGRALPFREDEG